MNAPVERTNNNLRTFLPAPTDWGISGPDIVEEHPNRPLFYRGAHGRRQPQPIKYDGVINLDRANTYPATTHRRRGFIARTIANAFDAYPRPIAIGIASAALATVGSIHIAQGIVAHADQESRPAATTESPQSGSVARAITAAIEELDKKTGATPVAPPPPLNHRK